MKILHVTDSYSIPGIKKQDVYTIDKGFSDYIRFFNVLKHKSPDIVHIHSIKQETFSIYACVACVCKIGVVRTLYAPAVSSYFYVIKQLCARFFYAYTICTSKFDLLQIDKFHLVSKSKRNLIYKGVDEKSLADVLSKDSARLYIYKKMGISFAKGIRIIGSIMYDDLHSGVEYLIDAAYLADKYKNLTNTILVILVKGDALEELQNQIQELHISGICFIIEGVENPEEYIPAFDIFVSPRTKEGDLYLLLHALYVGVPCIATSTGDTREYEPYASAPLVPPTSAKFLTEAIMYEIKKEKQIGLKGWKKRLVLPKKFTKDQEMLMLHDVYTRITCKLKKS